MSLRAVLGGCVDGYWFLGQTHRRRLIIMEDVASSGCYSFLLLCRYSGLLMFCEQVVHVQYLCMMKFKLPCIGVTRCIMVAPQVYITLFSTVW